ncbi:MAG: hypothetical protein N2235_21765 [Fischerella sp.]|nr:hypothetical protein [Fischerella sp.]
MVKTILAYSVILIYLVMTYYFFSAWLDFFLQDKEMNSAQRSFSGVILVLASILWPIVVPFAYLELLKFHKKHKKIIDILTDKSNSSIHW